jgi:4-hydroxy-tetrahydrodipicolinate synthase
MARFSGVIAAAATPIREDFSIDHDRLVAHCGWLLDKGGCDGVNLLGTTGEATSFSVEQRLEAMRAVSRSGLPMDRFMVGTGAAALEDAVRLTAESKTLGFAGALLLPPFYYKGIDAPTLTATIQAVVDRAGSSDLSLFLYHIPQNTGVPYPHDVVEALAQRNPGTLAGVKDSSGELAYSIGLAKRVPSIAVFPSSEGTLAKADEHGFAGCISATTNVNGALAQQGWRARGTPEGETMTRQAMAIREALSKFPLVSAVKWVLGEMKADAAWRRLHPPLRSLSEEEGQALAGILAATDYPAMKAA